MAYQQTQCLIFFRYLFLIDHRAGMQLQSVGRVTRKGHHFLRPLATLRHAELRNVKAVALLPVAFCTSHPSVISHFYKNGVHIVGHGDELRIDERDALLMVECLLDENLDDQVDSLPMILTRNCDYNDRSYLERIFDETSLEFRKKDASCTDALTLPAIDGENSKVFQYLLRDCHHYFDGRQDNLVNLLSAAIRNGQDLLVKLSLDHGANVNAVDVEYGNTALHVAAAEENKSATVELLLERGAHVDARNETGETPLHFAAKENQNATVELLLERGAHVDARSEDGETPLHSAAKEIESATVELLLEKGAHVDARNEKGETALHFAAKENLLNNAKVLLHHGADAEARCSEERTPLHYAAETGNDSSELVQLLIDEGASVNSTDKRRMTPLHTADNPEAAKTLLENGADPNCENEYNRTPLLERIKECSVSDVIKILLDYGALIDIKFDSNLGLGINGENVSDLDDMDSDVFVYLLNRSFVHVDFENSNESPKRFQRQNLASIFARHLVRVVSLKLRDRYSFDAADFWVEEQHRQPLSAFKEQCEMEVSRMKSQLIVGTDLRVYELLAKDEHQVARLFRNQSFTLDTDELKTMFPEYGLMLTCAVEKGRNRLPWHEQGIVSCNLLSANFKRMPDEIKESIVSWLGIADIRNVIEACAFLS